MSETTRGSHTKAVAVTALALGLAAGGYGVAQAADGSGSATSSSSGSTAATTQPGVPTSGNARPSDSSWGGQRSDETLLTGDTKSKVEAAAVAKVGTGATVVRVETDADGHAAYEVHMTKADGTPVTVYVATSFDVVSVETR
jgi:uncharacterized membrane protein YkoI